MEEINAVYQLLIIKSWDDSKTFEVFQEAWNVIAKEWGVESYNNGCDIRRKQLKRDIKQQLTGFEFFLDGDH